MVRCSRRPSRPGVLAIGITLSALVIALGFVLAIAFGRRTSLTGRSPGTPT
ncbi:MAG: hypothetical protein ACLQHS_01955 [Candidatus Limnocylindrales bacterium]